VWLVRDKYLDQKWCSLLARLHFIHSVVYMPRTLPINVFDRGLEQEEKIEPGYLSIYQLSFIHLSAGSESPIIGDVDSAYRWVEPIRTGMSSCIL